MGKDKPFLTFDQQVDLLRSRGLGADEGARRTLMRESYYSVVNGYKEMLLDRPATEAAGDDRYRDGSSFEALAAVFSFDRRLRELTFSRLVRAEATMRTAVVHAFCDNHREADAYLDPTSYCGKAGYPRPDKYDADLFKLIATLRDAHDNRWRQDSIGHYLDEYGYVPLWVLANTLTFGNVSHLYSLSDRSTQNKACRIISEAQSVPRISTKRLDSAFKTLVDFRNICAHDGRLYCAKVGKRHDQRFCDMVDALSVVLSQQALEAYKRGVAAMISALDGHPGIGPGVAERMGVAVDGESIVRRQP